MYDPLLQAQHFAVLKTVDSVEKQWCIQNRSELFGRHRQALLSRILKRMKCQPLLLTPRTNKYSTYPQEILKILLTAERRLREANQKLESTSEETSHIALSSPPCMFSCEFVSNTIRLSPIPNGFSTVKPTRLSCSPIIGFGNPRNSTTNTAAKIQESATQKSHQFTPSHCTPSVTRAPAVSVVNWYSIITAQRKSRAAIGLQVLRSIGIT